VGEDREDRECQRSDVSYTHYPAYDADIRNAIRYERLLAVKALIPLAMVTVVVVAYLHYH